MSKITKTFKSGNSIAVRLPKDLGIPAGVEMRVREERGRYVIEPVEGSARKKIDLTGIYGSCPGLGPVDRLPFKEREIDWEGKLLKRD